MEHRLGHHKHISNKSEWNNRFIIVQYVEVLNVNPCKRRDSIPLLTFSKAEFRGYFPCLDN